MSLPHQDIEGTEGRAADMPRRRCPLISDPQPRIRAGWAAPRRGQDRPACRQHPGLHGEVVDRESADTLVRRVHVAWVGGRWLLDDMPAGKARARLLPFTDSAQSTTQTGPPPHPMPTHPPAPFAPSELLNPRTPAPPLPHPSSTQRRAPRPAPRPARATQHPQTPRTIHRSVRARIHSSAVRADISRVKPIHSHTIPFTDDAAPGRSCPGPRMRSRSPRSATTTGT